MTAVVIEIADAVVAALNGASLSLEFEAERAWVEIRRLEDLPTLRVTVVPVALAIAARDLEPRHGLTWDVNVWIQRKADRTNASADALATLAEEVVELFRPWRARPAMRLVNAVARPLDPKEQDVQGVFSFVVTLSVRVTRP